MSTLASILGTIFCLVAVYQRPSYGTRGFPDLMVVSHNNDNSEPETPEISFLSQVQGPESLAFDSMGRGPYTGLADGRVVFWDGKAWTDFAYTSSSNRSEYCQPQLTISGYMRNEQICGRPLGLRFNNRTGELYIADAYFGLMKVGPQGGLATTLSKEAEGVPMGFTNDLDLDDDAIVYFTDSSTKYHRRDFMLLCPFGDNTGRILKYDPITKQTTVLMRGLQFPNGITLAKDGKSFIYAEGCPGKLGRYWLKGDKAGTSEPFAVLPGTPDNVRTNDKGEFWVALYPHGYTSTGSGSAGSSSSSTKHPDATVAKYGADGQLLGLLDAMIPVSEAHEKDGRLWLGTVILDFVTVYDLARIMLYFYTKK